MLKSLAILLSVFVLTGLSISTSNENSPQSKQDKATSNLIGESLDVRYARAHLELAKFDLRRAKATNKRIPNLLSDVMIDRLRRHVVIDEEQLEQYLIGQQADLHMICVRGAETAVEIAEANLKRRRDVLQRTPTTMFAAEEVERAEMVVKLEKINLERTRTQPASDSVFMHLQRQIEDLQHQVLELQLRK